MSIAAVSEQSRVGVLDPLQRRAGDPLECRRAVRDDDLGGLGADEDRRRVLRLHGPARNAAANVRKVRSVSQLGEPVRQLGCRLKRTGKCGCNEPGAVVEQIPPATAIGRVDDHLPIGVHREREAGVSRRCQHWVAVEHHEAGGALAVEDGRRAVVDRRRSPRCRNLLDPEENCVERHFLDAHLLGQQRPDLGFQLRGLPGIEAREL